MMPAPIADNTSGQKMAQPSALEEKIVDDGGSGTRTIKAEPKKKRVSKNGDGTKKRTTKPKSKTTKRISGKASGNPGNIDSPSKAALLRKKAIAA